MGNCASASAEDIEDSVELRVKKLLTPGGKRGKRKSSADSLNHARRLLQTKEGERSWKSSWKRLNLIGSNCERLIFSVECGQSLRNTLKNRYTKRAALRLETGSNCRLRNPRPTCQISTRILRKISNEADSDEGGGCEDPLLRLTRAPSDYVNAKPSSSVQSPVHRLPRTTLQETLGQHWQMIWESGVRLVAHGNGLPERLRAKYWPDETGTSVCYGQYTVAMETEETLDDGNLIRRELTVSVTGDSSETRRLRHLQYLGLPLSADWSGLDPAGFSAALPLSGVGRTGVLLCLLSFSIDGVRASQQVDVPAAVVGLRLSRPGMVHSRSQLAFVYKCLLHNLVKENLISGTAGDRNGQKSAGSLQLDVNEAEAPSAVESPIGLFRCPLDVGLRAGSSSRCCCCRPGSPDSTPTTLAESLQFAMTTIA
uniref:Tyrosine-protein phosphatase domain-containing protein n=1 Tax=Macrostomum lignano TaxID=282301 RepID=A0A1I8JQ49_9PLAT